MAKRDRYDVLNYVAYHRDLMPRLERAERGANIYFGSHERKQQIFLNFVLEQYVSEGVSELDDAKLPELLELKYKALRMQKRNSLGYNRYGKPLSDFRNISIDKRPRNARKCLQQT